MAPDPFTAADEANADRARLASLERIQREREARRRSDPADELELFNPNRRNARGLFEET